MVTEDKDTTIKPASKDDVKRLNNLMVGVIVVLSIAAGGLLVNALAAYQSSYTDLRDQVKAQNDKIDALTKALREGQEAAQVDN